MLLLHLEPYSWHCGRASWRVLGNTPYKNVKGLLEMCDFYEKIKGEEAHTVMRMWLSCQNLHRTVKSIRTNKIMTVVLDYLTFNTNRLKIIK